MPDIFVDISSSRRLPFVTGVQRVTRELLARLTVAPSTTLRFVAIVHCPYCGQWRRVTSTELDDFVTGSRLSRPAPLMRMVGSVNRAVLGERGAAVLHRVARRLHRRCRHTDTLRLQQLPAGSIFLDMDNAWHAPVPRSTLLRQLAQHRVTVMNVHYDIIPILFPQWVHPRTMRVFRPFLDAHLRHSALFLCISACAARDLEAYHRQRQYRGRLATAHIQLGAELPAAGAAQQSMCELPPDMGRFVLSVGTLEPRKNHLFLLDAFDQLQTRYPELSLVLVGREGWHATDIVDRIRGHLRFGQRLFWLNDVDDDALRGLYRQAELCVIPSHYEGFGLPVQEALAHRCVTLSSTGGALKEAGGDYARYFEPTNRRQLVTLMDESLSSPDRLATERAALAKFVPPSWDDTAQQCVDIIRRHSTASTG